VTAPVDLLGASGCPRGQASRSWPTAPQRRAGFPGDSREASHLEHVHPADPVRCGARTPLAAWGANIGVKWSLAGRDLISIADLSAAEITEVLDVASALKAGADPGRPLAGRNLAMIFQRPSNRTRVSFEVAVRHLGGHPIPLFNSEIQIGERESTADISRILDRYVDGIVARLSHHRDLVTMARSARGPVVNAMTDREHPCQVLADCLTIRELLGTWRAPGSATWAMATTSAPPGSMRPACSGSTCGWSGRRLRAAPRGAGARPSAHRRRFAGPPLP